MGLYIISHKTSHRHISRSLEPTSLVITLIWSLQNLMRNSAAVLPRIARQNSDYSYTRFRDLQASRDLVARCLTARRTEALGSMDEYIMSIRLRMPTTSIFHIILCIIRHTYWMCRFSQLSTLFLSRVPGLLPSLPRPSQERSDNIWLFPKWSASHYMISHYIILSLLN